MITSRLDFNFVPGYSDPNDPCLANSGEAFQVGTTFSRAITMFSVGPAESITGKVLAVNATGEDDIVPLYLVYAPWPSEKRAGEIVAENREVGIATGADDFAPGDVVYLVQEDGSWVISSDADYLDLSVVTRAFMNIRRTRTGEILLTLDSDDNEYLVLGSNGEMAIALPYSASTDLTRGTYYYDLFFEYTGSVRDKVFTGVISAYGEAAE